MNIITFLEQHNENNLQSAQLEANKKNKYVLQLKESVKNKNINVGDYEFLIKFYNKGGPITEFNKVWLIIKNLPNLISLFHKVFPVFQFVKNNLLDNASILNDIVKFNEKELIFTNDQIKAMKLLLTFFTNDKKTVGIYGYAGSGKTTLITKFIVYMFSKKFLKNVAFVAPTNKAVSVMKSKFGNDLDVLLGPEHSDETFNYKLSLLRGQKNLNASFLTIHKLLNFKTDFDVNGERIFVKKGKSNLFQFDVVIVDECSMISFDLLYSLFDDLRIKVLDKKNMKIPKVVFIGDPAQLSPVNEQVSAIFSKKIKKDMEDINKFKADIEAQENIILKQIVRSCDNDVVGICNEMRSWIIDYKNPVFGKFKGSKVKFYRPQNNKLKTLWFKKALRYFKEDKSAIILTWTNAQSKQYNDAIRNDLFGSNPKEYEIGDILILKDFYNYKEVRPTNQNSDTKKLIENKYYTSEQLKIMDIEQVTKAVPEFVECLDNLQIRNYSSINNQYIKVMKTINKSTKREYDVWKIYVQRLSGDIKNPKPIYVVQNSHRAFLEEDKAIASDYIRKLRTFYCAMHKEQMSGIDKLITKPVWREFNKCFIDTFANVSFGTTITVHKSQSSTFRNVFVDATDILKNCNANEAKRCLYTAASRTSNELHMLI